MKLRATLAALTVALGVIAAGVVPSSAHADGADPNSLLFADFENGDIKSGYPDIDHNKFAPYSVKIASSGRDSGASVHHELRQGDEPQAGGMRAESDALHFPPARFGVGDTRYYAFSVYLPSTWEYDSLTEDIVFQWHNTPKGTEPCEPTKTPSAFLAVHPHNGGEWRLRVNSDPNPCTTPETIAKTHLGLGSLALGQWTDFVFRFDWAYDASGEIEVWKRTSGNPTWAYAHHDGPNTYNDNHDSGYIKWGIYKPGWNGGAVSDVDKRAVFHDNIAVGTTCASVMPTGWAPPCAAAPAAPSHDSGHPTPAVTFDPPATRTRRSR
ncbi:polysaccharide lyase [Glycomyces sp. NPDC046736]|uniref:polysaccharide lyase n=1 Tax=Glycomyces sp. NPDC046736 TaxID=3155615 RepID=UPI0034015771